MIEQDKYRDELLGDNKQKLSAAKIYRVLKEKGYTYQMFLEVILESEVKQRDQNGIRLKKQFAK
ncbi:MAG TPA: hypothetical protein PKK61_10550 [Defluviitaleaceae bacterium]|nr:hypothetical protein [Defluviitaleaceae bacterium]